MPNNEDTTLESVDNTGSSDNNSQDQDPKGQSGGDNQVNWEKQAKELEKKLGEQGTELGKYRSYLQNIDPLLRTLEGQDDLVEAIMDGKINSELAKAVSEGKISLDKAAEVTKAHEDVKKDLGKKYDKTSADDIVKMVEDKMSNFQEDIKKTLKEEKDVQKFESKLDRFIEKTSDFAEYADAIDKWFDEHPSQTDIAVAYDAVKGKVLAGKAKEEADKKAAEDAKTLAGNQGGGAGQKTTIVKDQAVVDQLIGHRSDPNLL